MSRGKKVLIVLLGLLIALVCFAGAALGFYTHALNKALSAEGEDAALISEVCEKTNLDEPFYMLVLGSDSREGSGTSNYAPNTGDNERSDVMILVRIDAQNKKLTMVSIPRDTPYTYEDGKVDKLNETYNRGGAAETIKAVEEVSGVDISHFAEVRFSDLQGMVEALGGVTVDVDTPMSYKDALTGEWVEIPAGEQVLNGQQAQIFARARHEYETDQDMHRQQNVRQLAYAILQSLLDKPLYEIPGIALELAEYVGTDLKVDDLLHLVRAFSGGDFTMYSCTGPNKGDICAEAGDIWLCFQNPEGWKRLMAVVDSGDDPSGVDVDKGAVGHDGLPVDADDEPSSDSSGAFNEESSGQLPVESDGGVSYSGQGYQENPYSYPDPGYQEDQYTYPQAPAYPDEYSYPSEYTYPEA